MILAEFCSGFCDLLLYITYMSSKACLHTSVFRMGWAGPRLRSGQNHTTIHFLGFFGSGIHTQGKLRRRCNRKGDIQIEVLLGTPFCFLLFRWLSPFRSSGNLVHLVRRLVLPCIDYHFMNSRILWIVELVFLTYYIAALSVLHGLMLSLTKFFRSTCIGIK